MIWYVVGTMRKGGKGEGHNDLVCCRYHEKKWVEGDCDLIFSIPNLRLEGREFEPWLVQLHS